MSHYLRNYVEGGTYFFTVVTYRRQRILDTELSRRCLRNAIDSVRRDRPFEIVSFVLLPEHLHTVWTLPAGDADYSTRWRRIKEEFTKSYLAAGGSELWQTRSRRRHKERGVWHRRFWEHTIESEEELARTCDYVHWNPCKHGLVKSVPDWPHSSYHRFVAAGEYEAGWGGEDPVPGFDTPEWILLDRNA